MNYATGAVNKVKRCVLCGEMLLSTDRRVRRAHQDWPRKLDYAVRTAHLAAMVSLSQLCDGDYECSGTVRSYWMYMTVLSGKVQAFTDNIVLSCVYLRSSVD